MENKTATCTAKMNVHATFVNCSNMPLYWDGVRWSTWNPDTKITIVERPSGN